MKKLLQIPVLMPLQLLPLLLMVAMATAQNQVKKVAIMPLNFIGYSPEEMRYRLQDIVYNYLHRDGMSIVLQDPVTTNALLGRKEITADNLRNFLPSELASVLGVDYVIMGRVTQESAGGLMHKT